VTSLGTKFERKMSDTDTASQPEQPNELEDPSLFEPVHQGQVPYELVAEQQANERFIAERFEEAMQKELETGVPMDPSLKPYWIR
jgi:hypothetical protein